MRKNSLRELKQKLRARLRDERRKLYKGRETKLKLRRGERLRARENAGDDKPGSGDDKPSRYKVAAQ